MSSGVVKLLGPNLEVRFGIGCHELNRCHSFQDALAVKGPTSGVIKVGTAFFYIASLVSRPGNTFT